MLSFQVSTAVPEDNTQASLHWKQPHLAPGTYYRTLTTGVAQAPTNPKGIPPELQGSILQVPCLPGTDPLLPDHREVWECLGMKPR